MKVLDVADMGYCYSVWLDTGYGFMQRKVPDAGDKPLEVYEEVMCALCAKVIDQTRATPV